MTKNKSVPFFLMRQAELRGLIQRMWRANPTSVWTSQQLVEAFPAARLTKPDQVVEFPAVQGLHHYYLPQAA